MKATPSPGNSIALVLRCSNDAGLLSALKAAVDQQGGAVGAIDIVESNRTHITRRIVVNTTGDQHAQAITAAVRALPDVDMVDVYDCTFKLHEGGKLDVVSKTPLEDYVDLSMAYTPGVARVCQAVHKDISAARDYTIRRNTVGIVTDGSAVLGLGDIGAVASLPVMEGKAVLFKEFGGVNAFPVCLDIVDDVDLLVEFREPEIRPARRFFGLLHQLEDSLGCEVDLLTLGSLRNPYFRKRVLGERVPIYEG